MEYKVFVSGLFYANVGNEYKLKNVYEKMCQDIKLTSDDFYLLANGKRVVDYEQHVSSDLHAILRVLGGKGGFGSMLRAIGAQIEKTTNREACRDLSGRRLRDINEEKRLKAWLEKEKDRKSEEEEKRKRKLERLMAVPKHEFKDSKYETARSELTEKVSEAVEEGFKNAALNPVTKSTNLKRKAIDDSTMSRKKAALWIDEVSSGSDDSDSDNEAIPTEQHSSELIAK